MEDKDYDKEAIYDAEIAPLMTQIIDICKKNSINMIASFAIKHDEGGHFLCSSAQLHKGDKPREIADCYNILKNQYMAVPSFDISAILGDKKGE